jgi:hypothetical protein
MRRSRNLSVVLAAILVLPGLMAGGAFATCLHVDSAPHQCGALGVQCEMAHDGTSAQASHNCSCSHTPNLPADPAASVPTLRGPEPGAAAAILVPAHMALMTPFQTPSVADAHAPPAAHPPVFLLDCALLI